MDIFRGHHVNRVLDASTDVLRLKVRVVVAKDVGKADPFADQFQDGLHGDACAGNARLTEMDLGIDSDAACHSSFPLRAVERWAVFRGGWAFGLHHANAANYGYGRDPHYFRRS